MKAGITDRSLIGVEYRAIHYIVENSSSTNLGTDSWKFVLIDPCTDTNLGLLLSLGTD